MSHASEVAGGKRFEFGENWQRFLNSLDDSRIHAAERSLQNALGAADLHGKSLLDAGSGSGLFSLAARRLGAKVVSFDFDPQSVSCTDSLRSRFFDGDQHWEVREESVLDPTLMPRLGKFDIVYSYGVLHHTGAMWVALENLVSCVNEGGQLYVALYNDQGWKSHFWWFVKFIYCKLPRLLKRPYGYVVGGLSQALNVVKYTLMFKPMTAIRPLLAYRRDRGMTISNDMIDWIGGFPYEFVRADTLKSFLVLKGFRLQRVTEATSLGCHELTFVLAKAVPPANR